MTIEITLIITFIAVIVGISLVQKSKGDNVYIEKKKAKNEQYSEKYEKITRSEEHRALINKPYTIQCKSEIFSQAELDIINKYGAWLSALASNQIKPETKEQNLFIEECQNFRSLKINEMFSYFRRRNDNGSIQAVWFKYLCRMKFERENPSVINDKARIDWGWQGPPIESGDHVFFSK